MTDDTKKMADKIRALLTKAESTNFGPESEALIAKAHELMARYSIEEVMLHEASGVKDGVGDVIVKQVRVTANSKFMDQRHALIHQLGLLNRCKAIITHDFITILGFPRDVENTEVMYASLVTQMFGSLFQEPQSTSPPWANNFCFGFVERIIARLREVKKSVEDEVAPTGSSTALVLVDRTKIVEQKVTEMFPNLTQQKVKKLVYDPHARERGRAAADRSDIGQTGLGSKKDGIAVPRQELGS